MKIKKSQINNLLGFVVVTFSILLSKTVYFGIINRATYQYVYYGIIFVMLIFYKIEIKKMEKGIIVTFPLIFLMVINMIINKNEMTSSNINLVIGNCIYIASAMLIAVCISREQFATWYIRIMEIICIVSLLCWTIAIINPELAMSFCQPGYNWRVRYGYSPFYTWGWNGTIFQRNSGMFWEPGAFQGFILLALMMLLFNVDEGEEKNRKFKLILFIITMLTTQSTTGYILLIVLIIGCWKKIKNILGDSGQKLRVLLPILLAVCVFYIIFSSGNISEKLSSGNISTEVRFADILGGLSMCLKGGLIGLGETTTRDIARIMFGVNSDDSVGLLSMLYTYGLIFGTYYIGVMCCGMKHFFNNLKNKEYLMIFMFFFILHMTEGLWCLPIYLIIPLIGIVEQTAIRDNYVVK